MSSISLITFQERCGRRKRNSEDKKQNSAIGKFAEACVHSWLRRIHFLHPLFSSFRFIFIGNIEKSAGGYFRVVHEKPVSKTSTTNS